jgi:hypothetical protein
VKSSRHRYGGFLLAEVIVVLAVSSIVVVALLGGLIALIRGLQPQNVKLGGETLAIAPTFGAFPSAVRLHQVFADRLTNARAVYVFGGQHISIPTNAPETMVHPLHAQSLVTVADFSAGLPMDAKAFYELYATALGEQETAGSPQDFTVATVGQNGSSLALTCLVQVRRSDVSLSDGSDTTTFTVREVRLWDLDAGPFRYTFAERPSQAGSVFVGAVHTWMRYGSGSDREEGPSCVVFPDPWLYAGSRGRSDDVPAFSRFSYFLALSR